MKGQDFNKHAAVIGGSIAGLLAARVLSDHFDQVTLLERDRLHEGPESRRGQPQTRQLHGLLSRGLETITDLFPDLPDALVAGGALLDDMTETMHWYAYGGYRLRHTSGLRAVTMSRPFLEWEIRRRVVALPNVRVMARCTVKGLLAKGDGGGVRGVKVTRLGQAGQAESLGADLVIDASGRGSRSPAWLAALGYPEVAEDVVKVDISYATRFYHRDPDAPDARNWFFVTPEAPREKRMGGAFPVEGDRWIVGLAGWHGEHRPENEHDFVAFAENLPVPDVYNLITRNRPLSDIAVHKFPSSLRRRYEKLSRFPEGYLVLGDALCSFNPVYGQGMTSAALQAEMLGALLTQRGGRLDGLAKPFFKRAAKLIDVPWRMAVGEDFRFPETVGKKAFGTDFINAYVARVHRATHYDAVVCDAFLKVLNLSAPPASLFRPAVLMRVLGRNMRVNSVVKTRPDTAA